MNTNKALKMLIIPMIILAIILVISPISNASMGSNARAESGPMPYITPPDDPGGPMPGPSGGDPYADVVITVPHYVYVEGKIYENLKSNSEILDSDSLRYLEKGVPGVKVGLSENIVYDDDGSINWDASCAPENTVVTDSDGHFRINANEGTYELVYEYGNVRVTSTNQADVLYYNGYDYVVSELPSGTYDDSLKIEYKEIINAEKSVSQVFLLMDSSESMRHTNVVVDGVTKTRLQNAVDSAKVLVNELLGDNDNIYIGIVNFAGNNWRAASLSNNIDFLTTVLDAIATYPDYYYAANTNIVGAIDKAMESFYVDESDPEYWNKCNRTIVLISDGIATSDGETQTYCDETDEQAVSKMINTIGPNTRAKVQEVLAENVYFMNLLVKPTDSDEINYINSIYKDIVTLYKEVANEEELSKAIKEDIKDFIESHIEVGSVLTIDDLRRELPYLTDEELEQELYNRTRGKFLITGLENETRRKIVDSYFQSTPFYYDVIRNKSLAARSIIFNQIHAITSDSDAALLSKQTKMNGHAGPYNIDPPSNGAVYTEVHDIPEEDGGGTYTITYIHYDTGHEGQNVGLLRRPDFKLKATCTATGLRIMLNDNTIISTNTREINSTKPLIEYLDDDIAHGATIQVEFTVDILNDSTIPCNYIELVDCMPLDFIYNENYKLISETGTNKKYNWSQISIENLKDGFVSADRMAEYRIYYADGAVRSVITPGGGSIVPYTASRWTAIKHFDRSKYYDLGDDIEDKVDKQILLKLIDGKLNSGETLIPQNGHYQAKFVVSRVISSLDDIKHTIDNTVEVLGYDNPSDRRMSFVNDKDQAKLLGYPNNKFFTYSVYLPQGKDFGTITNFITVDAYTRFSEFPANTQGIDFSKATNAVMVVPPTGVQTNTDEIKAIVTLVISISIIICGFILNKTNKNKINN